MDTSTKIYHIAQTLNVPQQVELLHFAKFLQRCLAEKSAPKRNNLTQAFHLLTQLPVDCFEGPRIDPLPEERESL